MLAALVAVIPAAPDGEGGAAPGGGGHGAGRRGGRPGGVLRVGVTTVGSLDPAQARSIEQVLVADQLFDSLTAFDPRTLEAVPSLAVRWESSPDQRQWDFFLRPDAAFSNGRPVVAGDVKYSLERIARAGSGSPGSELLQPVAGYAAFRSGAPELAGVAAPAPDVVRIILDQPWAVLPTVLSTPVLGVVPRESVEASAPSPAFGDRPVGSGPFQVAARRGDVISLTPSPGSPATVAGVEVVQFADEAAAYRAFTRGRLDWARVPPQDAGAAARRYGREGFEPYLAQLFYAFNLRNPKLADVRFREAIVRAIDRRAIVSAVYHGTVRPINGMLLEGVAGYEPGACARCTHDPARARALLAEVFPPGSAPPEVALDYDDDPSQEAVARAMQASLREVGISLVLRPRPVDQYDEFALSGQQEVFRLGWVAAYPSPDALLSSLFSTGSPNNLMSFSSPAVDERLRLARAEGDRDRRLELFREAERAILEEVPVVPIAQFQLHTVVSERVRNLETSGLGTFDASSVWLADR